MLSVHHIENMGFRKVAAVTPAVTLGNPLANKDTILRCLSHENLRDAKFIVFPELSLTGYSIGDIFFQDLIYIEVEKALRELLEALKDDRRLIAIGLPLRHEGRIFNCAAVIASGKIMGVVPKINIPNYQEFYEKRWFHSGAGIRMATVELCGKEVPFGEDLLFHHHGITVGVEICEDLWVPTPPSSRLCREGAELILNLSATDENLGKYQYLTNLVASQSGRCRCVYAYSSAGSGESSTDLVFSGNDLIACNGVMTASSLRFRPAPTMATCWIDFDRIKSDRNKFSSFYQQDGLSTMRVVKSSILPPTPNDIPPLKNPDIHVDPHPFVPTDNTRLDANCREIISIQSAGLQQRLRATGCENLVIGVSGGLDSTLALLVAEYTYREMGLPVENIHGVTMPGEATSSRTYLNSLKLMHQLGVTHLEIPVREAVELHFKDIDHDPKEYNAVYENSQARERTQILMDLANKFNGMVLGTGDLSELALGWCTYNGDHMSMYNVNGGVPKTLVKHLVGWMAQQSENPKLAEVLKDILDTPISPELIPSQNDEEIAQKTESLVGPYELHDFFLYYMLRYGFTPAKIYSLARIAFAGKYDTVAIKKWLVQFYRRFFSQQFKRSCMPDGPKVGSVCLSPRGDWRMPSDISGKMWMSEAANLEE